MFLVSYIHMKYFPVCIQHVILKMHKEEFISLHVVQPLFLTDYNQTKNCLTTFNECPPTSKRTENLSRQLGTDTKLQADRSST